MRKNERMRKGLSILLCLLMLVQYVPTMAVAAETDGLCEHHTEHTADCGYTPSAAEVVCTHEHTEVCNEQVINCRHTAHNETCGGVEATTCTHACSVESGCMTTVLNCGHVENGSCCYVASIAETPCSYVVNGCPDCTAAQTESTEDTTEPSTDATEPAPVCSCGTDDAAIHATTCAVYVRPENPQCFCAVKCTEVNERCDICGVDISKCGGEDTAAAYDTITSGTCGDNLTWEITLNEDSTTHTLTISGSGAMADYEVCGLSISNSPWSQYGISITDISLPEGLTTIGANAFIDCYGLTELVIPGSVKTIGSEAIAPKTNITVHYLGEEGSVTLGTSAVLNTSLFHYCEEKEAIEATCVAAGHEAGWYCTSCQKYITGAETAIVSDNHNMVNGVCTYCTKPCEHTYEKDTCTICGEDCDHASVDSATAKCAVCGHQYVVSVLDEESSDSGDYSPSGAEAGSSLSYYDALSDVVAVYGTDNNAVSEGNGYTEDVDTESALTGPYTVTIYGAAEVGKDYDWSFKSNKNFVIQHGASLTVTGAFTLNGNLTNNGTIIVHGCLTLSNTSIPENITGGSNVAKLICGEKSYTWDSEAGKWICDEGSHTFDETTHACSVCGKVETFTVYWDGVYQLELLTSTSTYGKDFAHTFTVPENTHLEIDGVFLHDDPLVPVNYTYENGVLTIAAADLPAADIEIKCDYYVKVTFHANGGVIIPEDGYPIPDDTGFAEDGSYWIQNCPFKGEICLYNCAGVRREGYTFVDWRDESGKVYPMTQVNGEKYVSATEDVILYAQWQCNHTIGEVEFHDNGDGTHNGYCGECGVPLDNYLKQTHNYTYVASDNTITASCSANCGYSGTATVSAVGKNYNGNAVEATVSYSDCWPVSRELSITYAVKEGKPLTEAPKNAGTYTASITYQNVTASAVFTIAKKELTADDVIITLSPNSFLYDGSEKLPTVMIKLGDETLAGGTYADGYDDTNTTCDYQVIIPNDRVTPQRKAITIFFKNNYSGEEVVYYTITIPEAILSPAVPNGENGWYKDASLLAPSDYAISTIKDGTFGASLDLSDGNHESINYWLTYTDNANCEPVSLTWKVSIKVDGTAPTVSGTAVSITDSTASITVTAEDNLSDVASVTLTCDDASVTIGALTDGAFPVSGMQPNTAYTFTLTVKDEAGNETVTTVNLTTEMAASSVTAAPNAKADLTYDGTAQALITAGTAIGGEMQYSLDNQNWSAIIPTGIDAGDYTVWYYVKGYTNHYDSAKSYVEVTIAKATVTITAEDKTATVGDTKPNLTYAVTGLIVSDELAENPVLDCAANMNTAGTYTINVTGGDAGKNYVIQRINGTLKVKDKHTITDKSGSNGTITISTRSAIEGTEVIVIVSPGSGYKLSTLTVKDGNENSYAVSTDNSGKYYFTMPDTDVTVSATFTKISSSTPDPTNPETGDDFCMVIWSSIWCTTIFSWQFF